MQFLAHSMRPPYEAMRRAWRGSPLPAFLRWWDAELRAALARGARWRLLQPDGEGWLVRRPGAGESLARINAALPPAQQQAALRAACSDVNPQDLHPALALSAGEVLRRRLRLPLAAAGDLRQVVA